MQDKGITIGLDIGIASVGWAVLAPDRIVALGVRAFDKAETAKEGESLNLARRTARLMRRRLQRRAWRQIKVARLLRREGLIGDARFFHDQRPAPVSPWRLRVDGLDRLLTPEEWARVIYHLCKHRGFHWTSRAEERQAEGDTKGDGGPVTKALKDTDELKAKYRTAAEMVLAEFPGAQRNKQGGYGKSLSRIALADELTTLFQRQRELGNSHAGEKLESAILGKDDHKSGLLWEQHPPLSGQKMLDRIGRCTFERDGGPNGKGEYRASKASFTAERHVWLTRLNNLRIVVDGVIRPLDEQERRVALPLPYAFDTPLTYKRLYDALVKNGLLPDSFKFSGLRSAKGKDPLTENLIKLPAWQELRKALNEAGLKSTWLKLSSAALDGNPEWLDGIAWVLSVYKEDEEAERKLRTLSLPDADTIIPALLDFSRSSFTGFHALSLKALRKIVPYMETGMRYDEACVAAGYHHSQPNKANEGKELYLPPLYETQRGKGPGQEGRMILSERVERDITGGIPRNPVVLRAINQARKVVNALIRKYGKTYGSPCAVNIELARDLSRPLLSTKDKHGNIVKGRLDIEKEQAENRARNEADWLEFVASADTLGARGEPNGRDFEKWQLYKEQDGKCPYCHEPIDIDRLLEPKYAEVDHALPRSRSFDNGRNNKVLVHSRENQNKGNRTPHEYFQEIDGCVDGPRWALFEALVKANPKYRQPKKERLLRKNFGEKEAREFSERNLYDTRYICKFFKNYIEFYLKLADENEAKRCVVLSGQLTAFLRSRWGLTKLRGDSDRHHALDAAVVAACSHSMVKHLSDYARQRELGAVRNGFVNIETGEIIGINKPHPAKAHFPVPWERFRYELCARLNIDSPDELREAATELGTYPPEALATLRPLFVSRAVQRRGIGALHEATIRSKKLLSVGRSHITVPLHKLSLTKLDDIVGATDPRNAPLIDLLRTRLTDPIHNGDGKKAFAQPVYKPSQNGSGPLVKSVKVVSKQSDGVLVRGGVADLGDMLHVDVYRIGDRYVIEPAYGVDASIRVKRPKPLVGAEFQFSLTKNEYVRITLNAAHTYEGYFVMYESDGRMTLRAHDQPQPDKTYFRKSVASAQLIEKFHVDVLGNLYPAPSETRRDLA